MVVPLGIESTDGGRGLPQFLCAVLAKYRCQLYPQTELCSGSGAQPAHNPDLRIRGPFGFGDQVADSKPPQAAAVKSRGGERCGKSWDDDPGRYGRER